MVVLDLYEKQIKTLPPVNRLELVKLILNDIPNHAFVDYSSEWSDEDLGDVTQYAMKNANSNNEEL